MKGKLILVSFGGVTSGMKDCDDSGQKEDSHGDES
jgi:hypothetical protein